jgi:RHS repeat-associated protein
LVVPCTDTISNISTGGDDYFQAAIASGQILAADSAGTVYNSTCCIPSPGAPVYVFAGGLEDRNGNKISIQTSNPVTGPFSVTDTVGRTVVSGSGFGSSGNTVSVSGLSQSYTLTWGSFSSSFSPSSLALNNNAGPCNNSLAESATENAVTVIALPNGQQYSFSYDSTYGLLNKITYPTGGYVSYTWGFNPLGGELFYTNFNSQGSNWPCAFAYDVPAVLHRYVSFDGSTIALQQDFSYATTWDTINQKWTSKQTTVTTRDLIRGTSFQTVYIYNSVLAPPVPRVFGPSDRQIPVEQTVSYYGTDGSLLRTATKAWFDAYELGCELTTLDSGQISGAFYTYGSGTQVTDKKEYDYGLITSATACQGAGSTVSTPPSGVTPTRETVHNYQTFAATPIFTSGPSIFDRPSGVIAYGSGSRVAETDYAYDQGTIGSVSNLATGTHDETNYAAASTAPRGNPTTVTKQCFQGSAACTNAIATSTFDETGQVLTTTDACGNAACGDMAGSNHTTSYSYTDSYSSCGGAAPPSGSNTNAYRTMVTNALGQSASYCYGYDDGQLRGSTDRNNRTTTYKYNIQPANCSFLDKLGRLGETDYPDGGKTLVCYNDASPNQTIAKSRLLSGSNYLTNTSTLDGLGHVVKTVLTPDPDCASGDRTDTTYDGLDHTYTVSNPYCTTSDPTYGVTRTYYDALGRSCLVAPPDAPLPSGNTCPTTQPSDTIFTTYSGNVTTVTDPAGKKRSSTTDGLGRLTQVTEDPSGLGYVTTYTYDALNNLTNVVQNGSRNRNFAYDSLSHLVCASNPENSSASCPTTATGYTTGTTGYSYDANGNLSTKTAPAPNQTGTTTVITTYSYDVLNRLKQKSYSDGTTPTATYTYDVSSIDNYSSSNPVGRLVKTATAGNFPTAIYSSYDVMGRITNRGECVYINSCGTPTPTPWQTTNGYDLAGNLNSYTDATGVIFTQSIDGAGRPSQLTSNSTDPTHLTTLFTVDSSIGYFPNGTLRKATFGNGLIQTNVLNPRLQPCRIATNSTGTPPTSCTDTTDTGNILDFTYGFNAGTADNGNIASWSATGNQTFQRSFLYDSLNRIASMSQSGGNGQQVCSGSFGLSWTIDAWGNRTDQNLTAGTCNSFHQAINTKNQFVSGSYDAAGNLLGDGVHVYSYDAENRILNVDSGTTGLYVYDASGNRVAKAAGSTTTYYVYNPDGQVDSERDANNNWVQTYIHFGGKLVAMYRSSNTGFFHQDHLGSTRLVTLANKSIYENMDFLPFGEQIAGSSGVTHKFTGKERDSESSLDYFGARYYSSSLGRFMSPDWSASPTSVPYAAFGNPQSLNLYGYVKNNPLNVTDVDGHTGDICKQKGANCTGKAVATYDPETENTTIKQGITNTKPIYDKDGNVIGTETTSTITTVVTDSQNNVISTREDQTVTTQKLDANGKAVGPETTRTTENGATLRFEDPLVKNLQAAGAGFHNSPILFGIIVPVFPELKDIPLLDKILDAIPIYPHSGDRVVDDFLRE